MAFCAGHRKMQLLAWAAALEDGYGTSRSGDTHYPPTACNLAWAMIDAGVFDDAIEQKFGRSATHGKPTKEQIKFIRESYITKWTDKAWKLISAQEVFKTEGNHWAMEEGVHTQNMMVTAYYLRKSGRKKMEGSRTWIERKKGDCEDAGHNPNYDEIVIPYEKRGRWKTKTIKAPRVIDGFDIDEKKLVYPKYSGQLSEDERSEFVQKFSSLAANTFG